MELDPAHRRPTDASDELVGAVGRLSEAWEMIERARGSLFDFHQLTGHAHQLMLQAAAQFRDAGQTEAAETIENEMVGLNVLPGRWTFQVVEEYDDGYYQVLKDAVRAMTDQHMEGRRHVLEAELKQRVRAPGRPGQEATPDDL